jgi:HK97 family phage major capsid protein/HK97 family phage prohead protease
MKLPVQYRSATFDRESVDSDARTVRFSCSSEAPVERYFGDEILDHSPGSIRLGRMKDGAPLLMSHDGDDQIGVVESCEVSGRKLLVTVRFSKGEAGQAALDDVRDGIRRNVSVGYRVYKMALESEVEGRKVYRILDWEPLEVSLVSVPADTSVGIGRSQNKEANEVTENQERRITMPDTIPTPAQPVDAESVLRAERTRVSDIRKLGDAYKHPQEAAEAIERGATLDEFKGILLSKIGAKPMNIAPPAKLDEMEAGAKRTYSFMNVVRCLSGGRDPEGFEREVSQELQKNRLQRSGGFTVPLEMFGVHSRTMTANVGSAGGYTVATDILGSEFIKKLDNMPAVERAGARRLTGLVGDIILPKQTGGATAYWLGEGAEVSTSDLTFGQLALTPHRLQVVVPMTKQLMMQSTLDVEGLAREDAQKRLAIAIDLAALQGAGHSGQPKGLFSLDTTNSGINTVTYSAAATFAKTREAIATILTDNASTGPIVWLVDPATWSKWSSKSVDTGSGRFLWEGTDMEGNVGGYRGLVSQHVAATSKTICGVFSELLLGYWDGVDVIVDPYTRKKEGIIEVSATIHCDIAARYPQSFCVSTDSGAQ